jgi:hypothetical protein
MYRTILTGTPVALYARQFTSSQHARKTVTEKMSEVAEQVGSILSSASTFMPNLLFSKVNKKVGKGLASAIETGEEAAHKTKETVGQCFQDVVTRVGLIRSGS